ncbi:unnamed protein product [Pleuronectes platessa]|uniref:Uncharacterized protein n=1 Tax=Pleuronectes platessa TaxID=8262 RepID=A0A9N7U1Q7_PLEPL|nr:unnamed protein product [Pleuronectes platessa]
MINSNVINHVTKEMGITAMQLGVHDEVDFTSGRCQLFFGSPESWLLNKKWRDMLGSDVFQANVTSGSHRTLKRRVEPCLIYVYEFMLDFLSIHL